jgi:hypothetical protein
MTHYHLAADDLCSNISKICNLLPKITIFAFLYGLLLSTSASADFMDITSASQTGGPSEFGGHGVQMADVNDDGFPDFYVTMNFNDDMADLFFLNLDGENFHNEAAVRGIDSFDSGSHGGVWADLDNDGDFDLFNGAYEQNRIYRNTGSGMFEDITMVSGLPAREWLTRGVVAFDMDSDGDLDLFAVNGYRGSGDPVDERNEVYRNDGNMTFTAIDSGLLYTAPAGQGAIDVDYDGDGDIDILAANREGDVNILNNNGVGDFALIPPADIGISHQAEDGISAADINNDGRLDLLIGKHLYVRQVDGTYSHMDTFTAPGYMGGFEDLDNDGDWDLVFPGDNNVFFNDGTGDFTQSGSFDPGSIDDPRCVAFGDIDNDGDMDFYYAQKRTYNRLIRNDYAGGNGWLNVRLERSSGQTGAFGSKVYLYEAGKAGDPSALLTWREARSQEGYLAQNDPVLHFGTALNNYVDVRATFLGGTTKDAINIATNQTILISEAEIVINQPPQVFSGSDQVSHGLVAGVDLGGTVTDDGLPGVPGGLSVMWSMVRGPSPVSFDDPMAAVTKVYFDSLGTYVLRLTADDGELKAMDEMSVVVLEGDPDLSTIRVRVQDSAYDAEENENGKIELTNTALKIVNNQNHYKVGIRFDGIELPANAIIRNAFIQFKVAEPSAGESSLAVTGEAADHAAAFSSDNGNISSRATTANNVLWKPENWNSVGAAGAEQRTPDLIAIIQEIVDRPGWQSGQAMAFIISGSGNRVTVSYDGDAGNAPLLHVEFILRSQPEDDQPTQPDDDQPTGSGGGGGGCFINSLFTHSDAGS